MINEAIGRTGRQRGGGDNCCRSPVHLCRQSHSESHYIRKWIRPSSTPLYTCYRPKSSMHTMSTGRFSVRKFCIRTLESGRRQARGLKTFSFVIYDVLKSAENIHFIPNSKTTGRERMQILHEGGCLVVPFELRLSVRGRRIMALITM